MKSERFMQTHQIESAFVPVDMQTAANNGDWVNLALYDYVVCVLFKAAGTAGDDPVFVLKQAQDVAGTGSKALQIDTIFSKVGTLTGVAQFARNTQTLANSYTDDTSAESQALMAVEVRASDLDLANGFQCVQLSVADVGGNAQLGCGFYILCGCRYDQQIMPDAKV